MNEKSPIKIKIIKTVDEEKLAPKENAEQAEPMEQASPISQIWEKIAKIGLCVLVFLTPLFFLPLTIAPVEINKQFLALVLVLIVFFCYIIRSINSRNIFYPKSRLSLAVLIFLAITGISAIFSQARLVSIFGNFLQPDSLLGFLIYGLAFFLTAVFINEKKDLIKTSLCFFTGLALTTIFGLLQIFGKFILPWDFTQQTSFNTIGSVFGWGIFITFGLAMIITALVILKLDKVLKISLSLVGLLIMAALVILNFQMLWLGLALAMFLLTVSRFAAKTEMSLPLIIIVISLFFVLVNRQMPVLVNVSAEVRPGLATTLSIAKGSFVGVKQILLGSGPSTFGYSYSRFRPLELNLTTFGQIRFNQGFSFLTTILSTLGILGILSVFFIIYSFIRQGLKAWKDEGALIFIIGISFLLINLFIYPAFFSQLLFIFLGMGLLASGSDKNFKMEFYSEDRWRNIRGFSVFLGTIFLLSFSLFALYSIGQKYAAAIYYGKGLQSSSLAQSASWTEQAARLDTQSDQYLRVLSQVRLLQANELSKTVPTQENTQNIQLQFQNTVASAVNIARQAVGLNPIDSLNWSNLGNIYENIIPIIEQADVFAEQNYGKAAELEPNSPQAWVDLARVWIASADQSDKQTNGLEGSWNDKLDKAKTFLDKAIALKFDYSPAHFLIAQIYIREGNLQKAIERVELVKGSNLGDPGLAFQLGFLYYRNNQIDRAQSEFERAVVLSENYSNARYFLGLIYDQKGQKQKAIEQFEKVAQFNPDNQEVKKILDNLKAGRSALETVVPPAQPPAERLETPVSNE